MKHFMVLTHDEVQNNIPYALVCETMYGCRWNNGSRIRKFANEFTREEQKAISKMKKQSYECENVVRKFRYEENYEELTKAKENLSYASEKYNVAYEMFQRAHSALMDFEDHEF